MRTDQFEVLRPQLCDSPTGLRLLTSFTRAPSGLLIVTLRSRNILENLLRLEGK